MDCVLVSSKCGVVFGHISTQYVGLLPWIFSFSVFDTAQGGNKQNSLNAVFIFVMLRESIIFVGFCVCKFDVFVIHD